MPSTDVFSDSSTLFDSSATWRKYNMPVLSPRRSASSSLTASSYRSTYSSSSIDRPYYSSTTNSYTPRSTVYTSRLYSSTGKSTIEDARERSVRRDSVESSNSTSGTTSRSGSKASASSVAESVADLRNRYSPANYVPAVLRGKNERNSSNDNSILRSKSITDDMGRPPLEVGRKEIRKKDLSTSPRLNRASVSQGSPSPSTSAGAASASVNNYSSRTPNSIEKDTSLRLSNVSVGSDGPSAHAIRSLGLNGLKNIGNTCFMNSVLQCLSNTRLLLEYVKKDAYSLDTNTTTSGMKGALIKAFSLVIKELWSEDSTDRVVNTLALKNQIQRFAPRFMGYSQQDAQEFLRYLLEGLHEDVNRVTVKPTPIHTEIDEKLSDAEKSNEAWQRYLRMDNSRIVDIFVGQLKSTLRCTHCGHCSVTFDPFWDLSLSIPQRQGQLRLSQCLEHFTREETMDGDEKPTCSKCKERRKCTKSFSIQKFPKILVIHLKRFSPTERFRGKLGVTVDFPLEGLDMRAYAAADSPSECRYNLYAISNHSGTTYSGHYTAYCRHPYSHAWHEYNDSRVSSISARSTVSGEAYVLFYELESQKSHL